MSNPKNQAGVQISLVEIVEDKPPSAKVTFEIAGGNCGTRRVSGSYHYTAVYEDTSTGRRYSKEWSRAFSGVADPAFQLTEYVSLTSSEQLVEVSDEDVDDSRCG